MCRTVPLSIIRSFSLYTHQWYMSYSFADSLQAGSGRNQFRPDIVYIILPQVNLEFEVYMQKTYTSCFCRFIFVS